jgi:hypothetical protein
MFKKIKGKKIKMRNRKDVAFKLISGFNLAFLKSVTFIGRLMHLIA